MTSDNNWLQKATGRLLQAQTAFAMTHVGRFGRRASLMLWAKNALDGKELECLFYLHTI